MTGKLKLYTKWYWRHFFVITRTKFINTILETGAKLLLSLSIFLLQACFATRYAAMLNSENGDDSNTCIYRVLQKELIGSFRCYIQSAFQISSFLWTDQTSDLPTPRPTHRQYPTIANHILLYPTLHILTHPTLLYRIDTIGRNEQISKWPKPKRHRDELTKCLVDLLSSKVWQCCVLSAFLFVCPFFLFIFDNCVSFVE